MTSPGPSGVPDGGAQHAVLLVIPCLNEEDGLPRVLESLPEIEGGLRVVVVDNGSTDRSVERARAHGVEVVSEEERGYGAACLRGIQEHRSEPILAFVDADYSDYPEELIEILKPIQEHVCDFVVGSRMLKRDSRAALLPQSKYGNRLAAFLLRVFYGLRCTDLGPFRAIRWETYESLGMCDRNFGWTVEMQAKAGLAQVRYGEVAVSYRDRVGTSKITGTLRGTLAASYKILYTLLKLRFTRRRGRISR